MYWDVLLLFTYTATVHSTHTQKYLKHHQHITNTSLIITKSLERPQHIPKAQISHNEYIKNTITRGTQSCYSMRRVSNTLNKFGDRPEQTCWNTLGIVFWRTQKNMSHTSMARQVKTALPNTCLWPLFEYLQVIANGPDHYKTHEHFCETCVNLSCSKWF